MHVQVFLCHARPGWLHQDITWLAETCSIKEACQRSRRHLRYKEAAVPQNIFLVTGKENVMREKAVHSARRRHDWP